MRKKKKRYTKMGRSCTVSTQVLQIDVAQQEYDNQSTFDMTISLNEIGRASCRERV